MTLREKYDHALALRRAINAKKDAEAIIKTETEWLLEYIRKTGDEKFHWNSGLALTLVHGNPGGEEVIDPGKFVQNAARYLDAADYEKCAKESIKITSARKACFR